MDHFNFINSEFGGVVETKAKKVAKKKVSAKVEELEISEKVMNSLTTNEIKKVSDLEKMTEEELLAIKGIGKKGLKEIKQVLEDLGTGIKE
jgi:DNA-directed RNA polymerase subunit alpha